MTAVRRVGVLGAGVMGSGIAQVTATAKTISIARRKNAASPSRSSRTNAA